jgi:hypothetical protein
VDSDANLDQTCDHCGYDLQGLPEGRCPECGRPCFRFTDRARVVIQSANACAVEALGHRLQGQRAPGPLAWLCSVAGAIEPWHLLVAIATGPRGVGLHALESCGVGGTDLARVGRGDLARGGGRALRDDGVAEADDEDAQFEQALAHGDGLGGVVDDDRADGGGGLEHVEAGGLDLLAGVRDVVARRCDALGLAQEISIALLALQATVTGRALEKSVGRPRWMSSSVTRWLAGDESARPAAQGLAERAGEDVDLAPRVVRSRSRHRPLPEASALPPPCACRSVRACRGRVVPITPWPWESSTTSMALYSSQRRRMAGQVGDGAFHAEDAVGDDPDLPGDLGVVAGGGEAFSRELRSSVLVDGLVDALLDDRGQADGVDDAGVVEFIGDDDVARLAERGEDGLVGGPAGDERVGAPRCPCSGRCGLEVFVRRERAADEADGGGARAVVAEALDARPR